MRVLLLLAVLAVLTGSALSDSTLARRYRKTTDFVGKCDVARLNDLGNTKVMDLDFHEQEELGNLYYVVRGDGNLVRRGLYESTCPVENIAEFSNGWLYVSHEPCDCASPGEDVCTLSMRVDNEGNTENPVSFIEFREGQWSRPLRDLPVPLFGRPVLADSGDEFTSTGCGEIPNDVTGKIVMVDRGLCSFQQKFENAEAAGAVALIVVNSFGSELVEMEMTGSDIPGFMISFEVGAALKELTPKVTFGPGVGEATETDFSKPAGITHIPWMEIDDDTDAISWSNTFKYVKGGAFLDPRNYLWVVGPDGNKEVRVYDLRPGISTPQLVHSEIVFEHFVGLSSWRFFQRNGRTLLLTGDITIGKLQIRDVTDLRDIRIIDQIDVPFCEVITMQSDNADILYVESNPLGEGPPEMWVVHVDVNFVFNVIRKIALDVDPDTVDGTVSFIEYNENVLYVGLGAYGFSAYEIVNPRNPRFLATKRTYDGVAELDFTVGALTACTVPDHPEYIYVGNLDENGRSELVGYKLTIEPIMIEETVPLTSFTPMDPITVPAVDGITPDTVAQSSNYFGLYGDTMSLSDLGGDQTSSSDGNGDDDDDDSNGLNSGAPPPPRPSHVFIINVIKTPASHVLGNPPSPPPPPAPYNAPSSFSAAALLAPLGSVALVLIALASL